ncbi:hypothetical protein D3C76_1212570 [compost metagenome]
MITCDHDGTNACFAACCNCISHFTTRWIYHTCKSYEDKLTLGGVFVSHFFFRPDFTVGHSEDTQCRSGHALVSCHHFLPQRSSERYNLAFPQNITAVSD